MKFTEIQELTEIALVKVSVLVCNNFEDCVPDKSDKTKTMHDMYAHWYYKLCHECLKNIKETVSHLQLPRKLEKRVAALCRPVYLQMCTFFNSLIQIHSILIPGHALTCCCLNQVDFRQYYEWKSIGIIDGKRTVENLVHDEGLDVHFRFVIACYFCFENDIRSLWDIMPEESKINIRQHTCTSLPLISVWLKRLDGELEYGIRIVFESFLGAHDTVMERFLSNVSLLQYFLQVIPLNLRKDRLNFVAHRIVGCNQVMRFCLFRMNEGEQEMVYQNNPYAVLCGFLDWPWQKYFMKLAFITFDHLEERSYYGVMLDLFNKIVGQWRDYDYLQLLKEFWHNSPTHLKEFMRRKKKPFMESLISCLKKDYNYHDFH